MLGMQGTEMMRQLLSRRPRGINAFVARGGGGGGGADPGHHRGKVCNYQLDSILLVVLVLVWFSLPPPVARSPLSAYVFAEEFKMKRP